MNLTREEWCLMWEAIKHIEFEVKNDYHPVIDDQVKFIKTKIQQVIGLME